MKKYLISLERDQHRRELFFLQGNTQDFEVFSAINTMNSDPSELSSLFNMEYFSQYYGRNVTKGEIGCSLSHLAVYQNIINDIYINDEEYSLICEDDVLFNSDFQENLNIILKQKLTADIILVGQSKIKNFNDIELEINYPTTLKWLQNKQNNSEFVLCYPYKNYFAGTVAYLIKKSSAKKILDKVKEDKKIYWLADDFILFEHQFGLDIQIIRPLMAIENPKLNSNLEAVRGSKENTLFKQLIKYPVKKILAIKRNLGM